MTTNTNQPNRGNQGGAGQQNPGQSGMSSGRDQGSRFGATSPSQSSRGDETSRFLDAIEENVRKLRSAIGGSDEANERGDDARGGSSRGEREDAGSQGSRGI
jgi:hypothetical protein